ncbi:MAG: hypothetical protein EOO08_10920 [Chitinophagaceae bacterium]|nr:MAG: hypothetical protein EOO08_10920 [Chitinophagaceae bacterium]
MKKIFLPLTALVALAACNGNDTPSETTSTTTRSADTTSAMAATPLCYDYAANGDTVTLHLERGASGLSGALHYQLKEKDRNRGTFTVATETATELRGWYRFQSEGMESVREEVFQRKGDLLIPGYGPVQQSGDTARFESGAALQYDESRALRKVDCTN